MWVLDSGLFFLVHTWTTVSYTISVSPPGTDAAQKKSTRLKGGNYQPFCGALPWSDAGLQPADFSRVAVLDNCVMHAWCVPARNCRCAEKIYAAEKWKESTFLRGTALV